MSNAKHRTAGSGEGNMAPNSPTTHSVTVNPTPSTPAKVMLFTPVRMGPQMSRLMVDSHANLNGIGKYVYLDDCEPSDSQELRENLSRRQMRCSFLPTSGLDSSRYANHDWSGGNWERIAAIRNRAIAHFLAPGNESFTHLFIVDADLLLHPDLVTHLVSLDLPVVSEVFWSKWKPTEPYMPNVWDVHGYAFHSLESILRLREPGVYEVGGLGACTLIHRSVLEAGINYDPIPSFSLFGEDRAFCLKCSTHEIPLYADTRYTPFHIYRPEEMLKEAEEWLYRWDCEPGYFRDMWLGKTWREEVKALVSPKQSPRNNSGTIPPVIAVCLPGERFSSIWVNNWTTIFHALTSQGCIVLPFFCYSSSVYATRNLLWKSVAESLVNVEGESPRHVDYVLWIDDDNILAPAQLAMLLQDLNERPELDAVAAWCWTQADGYVLDEAITSCGYLKPGPKCRQLTYAEMMEAPNDIIEVNYTGFPAVLMRGSLLGKMGKHPFAAVMGEDLDYGMAGEDVSFWVRATGLHGVRLAVDRRVKVPHLKTIPAEPAGAPAPTISTLQKQGQSAPADSQPLTVPDSAREAVHA